MFGNTINSFCSVTKPNLPSRRSLREASTWSPSKRVRLSDYPSPAGTFSVTPGDFSMGTVSKKSRSDRPCLRAKASVIPTAIQSHPSDDGSSVTVASGFSQPSFVAPLGSFSVGRQSSRPAKQSRRKKTGCAGKPFKPVLSAIKETKESFTPTDQIKRLNVEECPLTPQRYLFSSESECKLQDSITPANNKRAAVSHLSDSESDDESEELTALVGRLAFTNQPNNNPDLPRPSVTRGSVSSAVLSLLQSGSINNPLRQ